MSVHTTYLIYLCFVIHFYDYLYLCLFFFFFFSSRRRHTRCLSDWSSDVCSSDLVGAADDAQVEPALERVPLPREALVERERSEERRVGKECRSRWSRYH